jgi:hypothetical protein
MKRALIPILILFVAAAAVARPAGRGQQGPGGPRGAERALLPPRALAEFLGLSEAQVTQVQTLRETRRAAVEPLLERRRANQVLIKEAVDAGNSARAGELLLANDGLREQIKGANDSFKTSLEALLTPAQKSKWAVYEEIQQLRTRRPDGPRKRQ